MIHLLHEVTTYYMSDLRTRENERLQGNMGDKERH